MGEKRTMILMMVVVVVLMVGVDDGGRLNDWC